MERNADEEGNQKLGDLPIESIKRICSCLNYKDLLRVCTNIPGWKYVLSLPYNKPLIANYLTFDILWLDDYLCKFISFDSGRAQFSDVYQAFLYYSDAESKVSNYSASNAEITANAHKIDRRCGNLAPQKEQFRTILPGKILERVQAAIFFEEYFRFLEKGKNKQEIFYAGFPGNNINKCLITNASIIIFGVNGPDFWKPEYEDVFKKLNRHQVLLVMRFKFWYEEDKSNLQCLSDCYQDLKDYLSGVASGNWRIWCLENRHVSCEYFEFILKWACSQMPATTS